MRLFLLSSTAAAPVWGEVPPDPVDLLSLAMYVAACVGIVGLLLFLAWALGHKTRSPMKGEPFEGGIRPTGEARPREPVPFYLVAIFFIIFDVETVFIVSWAVAYDLLGWTGFVQMAVFVVLLLVALVYLWKAEALNWGPRAARKTPDRTRDACR